MPNREERLNAKLEKIREIARESPGIDEKRLLEDLLLQDKDDYLPASLKTRAYIVSLLFFPFGLYYAVKFFFRAELDARKAAYICLGITVIVFIIGLVAARAVFSSVPELDQLSPNQINDLIELYR